MYAGKWTKWSSFARLKGRGAWLHLTDESQVLNLLLESMAWQLISFKNQQSTARGYLVAIKFYHELSLGCLGAPDEPLYDSGSGEGDGHATGGV